MLSTIRIAGVALALVSALGGCSSSATATPQDPSPDAGVGDAAPVDLAPAPDIVAAALPTLGGSLYAAEPSIAVAPSGAVAVAWLDVKGSAASTVVSISADRGETWSTPERIALPEGRFGSNEIVQADADSAFYVVTLGVKKGATSSNVYLAKAEPGATTFGPVVQVSDAAVPGLRDASAFVIAKDRSFNVVWTEYSADLKSASIVTARSTDQGGTWVRQGLTEASGSAAWPNLCASRESGGLVAVYVDPQSHATGIRWSEDNGATWPAANHNEAPLEEAQYPGEFPSCVTEGADFWVLQGISTTAPTGTYEPTLVQIAMTRSRDRGRTLETPVSVGDPQAGSKTMRAMATLQPDHSMSLVYYAGVKDDDKLATVRRSVSTDGGKTFGPSQTLHSPIVLTTSRTGNDWLGDLLGVTSDARNSFVAFVDNQSGASRIRFSRLALAPR